jgi:hypothetical protein
MTVSTDSKLGDIFDNPKYLEVFNKHIPGLSENPMVGMAKGLAIKYLLKQPQAKGLGFTQEKVAAILEEINALDE